MVLARLIDRRREAYLSSCDEYRQVLVDLGELSKWSAPNTEVFERLSNALDKEDERELQGRFTVVPSRDRTWN